jgi:acetyltransferase-like isoleucine patch superfamily enzyme
MPTATTLQLKLRSLPNKKSHPRDDAATQFFSSEVGKVLRKLVKKIPKPIKKALLPMKNNLSRQHMTSYTVTNAGPTFQDNAKNQIVGQTKAAQVTFTGRNATLEIVGLAVNNADLFITLGTNAKVYLGKNIRLAGKIRIHADDNATIFLGDDGRFADTTFSCAKYGVLKFGEKCEIHRNGLVTVAEDARVELGGQCTFRVDPFIVAHRDTSIVFGHDCMAAGKVHIRSNDGHSIFDLATDKKLNPGNKGRKVNVGNHVWLGYDSMLMYGTDLGDNVIVGAKNLVRNEFPANTIVAGNPAKVIRHDVNWDRREMMTFDEFTKLEG